VKRRPIRAAKRVFDAAVETVPGAVVEKVTAATAPLTRYSGRTHAGAAALSSALAVLAQPPRPRNRRDSRYTKEEIATHVNQTSDVVSKWVDAGWLAGADDAGTFGRDAVERATLIAFATRRGASDSELQRAVDEGQLPLMVLEHVIAGEASLTAREVAAKAGVPLDMALDIWRALGMPVGDLDEPAFTRNEVSALRTMGALRAVFTREDLVEAASVVGRAMADVGAASAELFRRRLTARFMESGGSELDVALRLSAVTDLLVPPLGPLLEVVLRRHLMVTARAEAAMQIERSDGASLSERELTVAFADLVGFTTASQRLSALEVSQMAAQLLHCAESVLPRHEARLVKSIGDAVMFTSRDPVACAKASLDLIETAARESDLPPVRAGAAHGPVLRAYADYFGRTVNLAARLCDAAPPGTLLLHAGDATIDDAALSEAGLRVQRRDSMRVKGVDDRVAVLRIRPSGD